MEASEEIALNYFPDNPLVAVYNAEPNWLSGAVRVWWFVLSVQAGVVWLVVRLLLLIIAFLYNLLEILGLPTLPPVDEWPRIIYSTLKDIPLLSNHRFWIGLFIFLAALCALAAIYATTIRNWLYQARGHAGAIDFAAFAPNSPTDPALPGQQTPGQTVPSQSAPGQVSPAIPHPPALGQIVQQTPGPSPQSSNLVVQHAPVPAGQADVDLPRVVEVTTHPPARANRKYRLLTKALFLVNCVHMFTLNLLDWPRRRSFASAVYTVLTLSYFVYTIGDPIDRLSAPSSMEWTTVTNSVRLILYNAGKTWAAVLATWTSYMIASHGFTHTTEILAAFAMVSATIMGWVHQSIDHGSETWREAREAAPVQAIPPGNDALLLVPGFIVLGIFFALVARAFVQVRRAGQLSTLFNPITSGFFESVVSYLTGFVLLIPRSIKFFFSMIAPFDDAFDATIAIDPFGHPGTPTTPNIPDSSARPASSPVLVDDTVNPVQTSPPTPGTPVRYPALPISPVQTITPTPGTPARNPVLPVGPAKQPPSPPRSPVQKCNPTDVPGVSLFGRLPFLLQRAIRFFATVVTTLVSPTFSTLRSIISLIFRHFQYLVPLFVLTILGVVFWPIVVATIFFIFTSAVALFWSTIAMVWAFALSTVAIVWAFAISVITTIVTGVLSAIASITATVVGIWSIIAEIVEQVVGPTALSTIYFFLTGALVWAAKAITFRRSPYDNGAVLITTTWSLTAYCTMAWFARVLTLPANHYQIIAAEWALSHRYLMIFAFLTAFKAIKLIAHQIAIDYYTRPTPTCVEPKYTPGDVTVILQTRGPKCEAEITHRRYEKVLQGLASILENHPAEVIIPTIGADKHKLMNLVSGKFGVHRVKVTSVAENNRRLQFLIASSIAQTPIICYANTRVSWPCNFLTTALLPFNDDSVSLVTTPTHFERKRCATRGKSFVNYLQCQYFSHYTYDSTATNRIDGGIALVAGRTALIRTEIVQAPNFRFQFPHDSWLFGWTPLTRYMSVGANEFITRFVRNLGKKTVFCNTNNATVTFSLPPIKKTPVEVTDEDTGCKITVYVPVESEFRTISRSVLNGQRSAWRSTLTSFTSPSILSIPWTAYSMLVSLINFPLVYDPLLVYLAVKAGADLGVLFALVWLLLFSKVVRQMKHLYDHPEDWWFVPGGVAFSYLASGLKLWGAATSWDVEP